MRSLSHSNTFASMTIGFRLMRMPLFLALSVWYASACYFVGGIAAELIEKYAQEWSSLVILGFIGSNMLHERLSKALKEDA